ncbi:MAG: hypothetical protein ABIP29_07635 [Candidatus Eisenbacteria bacterium]
MIGMQPVRGRIRVLALVAFVLVPGLVLARPAAAADGPGLVTRPVAETNTALLARASRAVAGRLVARAPLTPGSRVGLRAEGAGALDTDMREALLQALNARRISCVLLTPIGVEGDSGSTAEEPPARPTGPGGGAAGASSGPSAGSNTDLARLAKLGREAQTNYDALQAERKDQAARADSLSRLSGGGGGGGGAASAGALSAPATSGALPVLTWRVQEARVDYVRMFRGGIFGAQRVERRAHADLALRLTPAGGDAIAWSASADTTVGDVVLKSDLLTLEDRTRPETRPALPNASFKKVLEPALVVVLIAGLVSLFYQNRP